MCDCYYYYIDIQKESNKIKTGLHEVVAAIHTIFSHLIIIIVIYYSADNIQTKKSTAYGVVEHNKNW